jgi:predicted cupin superfamily sugar epimerase
VAGGRFYLKKISVKTEGTLKGLRSHRSAWSSIKWILTHSELSKWNRLKVFVLALILKLAHSLETVRLSLSGKPERR